MPRYYGAASNEVYTKYAALPVYMMASANKFLRRYYASLRAYLDTLGNN